MISTCGRDIPGYPSPFCELETFQFQFCILLQQELRNTGGGEVTKALKIYVCLFF